MTETRIAATPFEVQKLALRIAEAKQAEAAHRLAVQIAEDLFGMFCVAHGVEAAGAQCLKVDDTGVTVGLPDKEPDKKLELVQAS